MTPNLDMEIVVLESVLANAKDRYEFEAGLMQAVKLLKESAGYISETVTRAEQAEADLHFYKGAAGGMVRTEDGSLTEFGKTLQELRDVRAYAVSQTQLLDRALKMMQMAGYGVAPHDADHNNPVIAWMAEARELLAKDPAQPALGSLSSPQTGAQPERHETCTKDWLPRIAELSEQVAKGSTGYFSAMQQLVGEVQAELRHQSGTHPVGEAQQETVTAPPSCSPRAPTPEVGGCRDGDRPPAECVPQVGRNVPEGGSTLDLRLVEAAWHLSQSNHPVSAAAVREAHDKIFGPQDDVRDAARYRWLRSEDTATNPLFYPFWREFNAKLCREADMDALIDSAMTSRTVAGKKS